MSKQTAVEWLVEELFKKIDYIQVDPKIINHAIAMEREQIIDAYHDGQSLNAKSVTSQMIIDNAMSYYNETFNK